VGRIGKIPEGGREGGRVGGKAGWREGGRTGWREEESEEKRGADIKRITKSF
jgi:hypothetical protein